MADLNLDHFMEVYGAAPDHPAVEAIAPAISDGDPVDEAQEWWATPRRLAARCVGALLRSGWDFIGPSETPLERVLRLRAAALAAVADMECEHRASEHGNCSDCMNTGYAISCQQEADVVDACLAIIRVTNDLLPKEDTDEPNSDS